jgi:outer membrane autotransporter protein
MKRILAILVCVTTTAAWVPAAFAQQQTAVGPGIIPLNATGILNGVVMSSSGTTGTLTVGVPGGPETDIFTLNNPPVAGLVAVATGASSQGNIVFNSSSTVYGAIGVTQPGGPFLLAITGGNTGTAVNFLGPVFATTVNVTGTGSVNFNSGSTNITATNFAADGTISLAPNTTVIGALTTTAGADTGTLVLGSASVLNGAVGGAVGLKSISVIGGSNLAGVSAAITGAVDAYTFSLGTNTLNIGGALTIANTGPGGVINTTLASPSVYGNIRPVGATNLGPALTVDVTVPSSAFIPVGTKFNIIQTATGTVQSGTNGSVVTVTVQDPTNPLYTFSAVPAAGTIAGLVTIQTTGIPLLIPILPPPGAPPVVITPPGGPPIVVNPPAAPLPAGLPPTLPVAAAVVPALLTTPLTPDLANNVLPAIDALTTPGAVVAAVAQLAPSAADVAAPLVTFQMSQQFQDLLSSRLLDQMCGLDIRQSDDPSVKDDDQHPVCRQDTPRTGLWIKAFGEVSSQNAQGSFVGYTASIYGTMIGYDVPLGPDTRAGLAFGIGHGVINGDTYSANTTFNSYNGIAYIGHTIGQWYVNGNLSFGWNDYSENRNISFPGLNRTATGNYSGQDYAAFVTTGYHFYAQGLTITPVASLQYTHVNLGSYSEGGAGGIGLNVNAQSYDFLESGLGVKVARPFAYQNATYVPELHFMWFHELSNPLLENTAAFNVPGAPPFTTPGFRPADDMLNVGARMTILSCACKVNTWSLDAAYDFYWTNAGYIANRGMLRFSYRF